MSIEALNYAIRVGDRLGEMDKKRITPTEALLLVHLCNHVDGQWRWESDKETLARRCITSPRTIQTGLRKFQQWGLISLRKQVGHRGQDVGGFEFWVHEATLRDLAGAPEAFFEAVDAGSENSSTPSSGRSENISHPAADLWITGSENSSTPGNTREENSSTLAGSEIFADSDVENFHPQRARTSFKPSREPSSSSSPPPPEARSSEGGGEPAAGAAGEEEPVPGVPGPGEASGGSPAASGGETPSVAVVEHARGAVSVAKIQSMLAAVGAGPVTGPLTEAFIALVLDRSREITIANPTGFVAAAVRNSPGRTKVDLARLREPATASGAAVAESQTTQPELCPIPGHRDQGRRQANCPECRGITGEFDFPEVVSKAVFERLAGWQQHNLVACRVEVRDVVDEDRMRRSVLHSRDQALSEHVA